jgi:hypothetical protein
MLKDIHTATHPARLERTVSLATPAVSEAQDCGPEAARDALLAALAEEARDEEGGLPS